VADDEDDEQMVSLPGLPMVTIKIQASTPQFVVSEIEVTASAFLPEEAKKICFECLEKAKEAHKKLWEAYQKQQ